MTHFTGALPKPSRATFSLGQAGATKVSTTNLPSGPLRTTTLPPGPENIVTSSASRCVLRGAALNLARILARRSAGEGIGCALLIAEARSDTVGKKGARRTLHASVAEPRNTSRRVVCFGKRLNFIFVDLSAAVSSRCFGTPLRDFASLISDIVCSVVCDELCK